MRSYGFHACEFHATIDNIFKQMMLKSESSKQKFKTNQIISINFNSMLLATPGLKMNEVYMNVPWNLETLYLVKLHFGPSRWKRVQMILLWIWLIGLSSYLMILSLGSSWWWKLIFVFPKKTFQPRPHQFLIARSVLGKCSGEWWALALPGGWFHGFEHLLGRDGERFSEPSGGQWQQSMEDLLRVYPVLSLKWS